MKINEVYNLEESSGYSLEGSYTPDLVFSKYWLMQELAKIQPEISVAYILGAWYCNLALYFEKFQLPQVDKIINVETNKEFLSTGKKILDQLGADNVEYMLRDANDMDYRQLDSQGAVINTSLNDIKGRQWFDRIPPGALVALQGRDQTVSQQFDSADNIQQKFPLSQVLYSGALELQDPETAYSRFMTIGIK
jgi:hypothetical protein